MTNTQEGPFSPQPGALTVEKCDNPGEKRTDVYLGRTIVGSEGLVSAILDEFPMIETFQSDGL